MKTRLASRARSRLAPLAVAIATLGVPSASQAQRAENPQGRELAQAQSLWRHLDARLDSLADALSLNADQKERLAGLAKDFRATNADALASWNAMRREMRKAMANRDRAAIGEARRRWAEKHGNPARELAGAFAVLKEDVEATLDDSQREKLDLLMRREARRLSMG